MSIKENIVSIKKNIEDIEKKCNRQDKVNLMAVTKTVDVDKVLEAIDAGITDIGENKPQELARKYEAIGDKVRYHLIGTLQTNKVKYIIDKAYMIHSLDRIALCEEIQKRAEKIDKVINCLVQVNISKEESKHGFEVEEIDEVFNSLKDYPHVKVRGLMMMAPHIESSETERYFKMTQELLQRLQKDYPMYQLDQLSMGMSNDYHEALKHGSTMIRIGSALFK